MRLFAVALVGACFGVSSAEAVTYYYVSSPYIESNYDTDAPPVITIGQMEIDETLVPGGLANTQLRIDNFTTGEERSWQDINPAVKSVSFTNGQFNMNRVLPNYGVSLYFNFDADKQIISSGGVFGEEYAEGRSNDLLMPDTFGEVYMGGSNNRRGHYSDSRITGFQKTWFSDAIEWAGQVAQRVLYGSKNPPSNACRVSAAVLKADDYFPV